MTKKISPELAAAPKAAETDRIAPDLAALLTSDEREVLRAARQHARLTSVSLWDVSSQIIAMTSGDLAARKVAARIGVPWPALPDFLFSAWPPPFGATFLPKLFIEQRWGELLVAAVEAGDGTASADLLASPVVRILLGMARDGLQDGRPEFEDVVRRLATALSPRRPQGRRTRRPIAQEEKLLHADFLYRAFDITVDWTRQNRPRKLSGPSLVAYLKEEPDGQRRYWPALGRAGYLIGARLIYEDELLPYVVEAAEMPGKRTSSTNAAFHRFAVAHGFAPADSTPADFLRSMRQAVPDIRYRKGRNSKPLPDLPMIPLRPAITTGAGGRPNEEDEDHRPAPSRTGQALQRQGAQRALRVSPADAPKEPATPPRNPVHPTRPTGPVSGGRRPSLRRLARRPDAGKVKPP